MTMKAERKLKYPNRDAKKNKMIVLDVSVGNACVPIQLARTIFKLIENLCEEQWTVN